MMKRLSFKNQRNSLVLATIIISSIMIVSVGGQVTFAQSTENATKPAQSVCTFQGAEYSPGAVVTMPGGNKTCHSSGVWV